MADFDVSGLTPLDTSGLKPLDTSQLRPLDISGLKPLDGAPEDTGIIGSALSGIAQSGREIGQSGRMIAGQRPEETPEPNIVGAQPMEWWPPNPRTAAAKLAYQFGKSAPTVAGGVLGGVAGGAAGEAIMPAGGGVPGGLIGGAAGAGLATTFQALGPEYARALKEMPDNPDRAFDKAVERAGASGAISGAAWAAFGWAPFKTMVKDVVTHTFSDTIKNTALQALAVQPGIAVAGHAGTNVMEGRPAGEGVAQDVLPAIAGTAVPLAGHAAVRLLRGRQAPAAETPAAEPSQEMPPAQPDQFQHGAGQLLANKPPAEIVAEGARRAGLDTSGLKSLDAEPPPGAPPAAEPAPPAATPPAAEPTPAEVVAAGARAAGVPIEPEPPPPEATPALPIPEPPTATAAPAEPPAGIPFMITQAMRRDLADLGWSPEQVGIMAPAVAHSILNSKTRAPQAEHPPTVEPEPAPAPEPPPTPPIEAAPKPATAPLSPVDDQIAAIKEQMEQVGDAIPGFRQRAEQDIARLEQQKAGQQAPPPAEQPAMPDQGPTPAAVARVRQQITVDQMAQPEPIQPPPPRRQPPRRAQIGPQSLAQFLAEKGGINTATADVTVAADLAGINGLDTWHLGEPRLVKRKNGTEYWTRQQPGQPKLVNPNGLSMDDARNAAAHAGYISENGDQAELAAALRQEVHDKNPVYTEEGQIAADQVAERQKMLAYLDRHLGIDASKLTDDEIAAAVQQHAERERQESELHGTIEDETLRHDLDADLDLGETDFGFEEAPGDLFDEPERPANRVENAAGRPASAQGTQVPGQPPLTYDTVDNVVGATQQAVIPGAEQTTPEAMAARDAAARRVQQPFSLTPTEEPNKGAGHQTSLSGLGPPASKPASKKAAELPLGDGKQGSLFQPEDLFNRTPAKPVEPTKIYAPTPKPGDHTAEFNAFRQEDPGIEAPQMAKAWVLEQGRKDGNEHMVLLHPDGRAVEAITSGRVGSVRVSDDGMKVLATPDADIDGHHNHPGGTPLSPGDLGMLANPGLRTIWAHVDPERYPTASSSYGARLVDGVRQWIGNDIAVNNILITLSKRVGTILENFIKPVFDAGQIPIEVANLVYQNLQNRALADAGLIHYLYDPKLDQLAATHPVFGEALAEVTRRLNLAMQSMESKLGPRPDRGAGSVRLAGDVAGVPERGGAPTEEPDGRSGTAGGSGRDGRPQAGRGRKEDPRQLKLLEDATRAFHEEDEQPFRREYQEVPRPPEGGGGAGGNGPAQPPAGGLPPPPASPGSPIQRMRGAIDRFFHGDLIQSIVMGAAPMGVSTATPESRALPVAFASAKRYGDYQWDQVQKDLIKRFPTIADQDFLDKMDQQSVAAQRGEIQVNEVRPGVGWGDLTPKQLETARQFDAYANGLVQQMVAVNMLPPDFSGIPHWTPRLLVHALTGEGVTGAEGFRRGLDQLGRNITATTQHTKQRKYETRGETEAAAQQAFGPDVMVSNNIRTMAVAMHKIEDAINGRRLVNEIKEIGTRSNQQTVLEGDDRNGYFTIPGHPAFMTTRYGTDADGVATRQRVPLYIRNDFEGPLRSIMTKANPAWYQALMHLKAGATSAIMLGPAIHNAVVLGKAIPLMGAKALGPAQLRGRAVRGDAEKMKMFFDTRGVLIGQRGYLQDISDISNEAHITPGHGLTAKAARWGLNKIAPGAGDAVARMIDTAGDLVHNKLLWDRIGDLQLGIWDYRREYLQRKNPDMDARTASVVAANLANRIAGALPMEAMSRQSRMLTNLLLFSRTFNVSNLGLYKDMFGGLPKDVQADIARHSGELQRQMAVSASRRSAVKTVTADIGLMIVANSAVQSAMNVIGGSKTLQEEEQGYVDRFNRMVGGLAQSPLDVLDPVGQLMKLSSTAENEPGKEGRVKLPGLDATGRGLYMRLPFGKMGEDFSSMMSMDVTKWFDLLQRKEGTIVRPTMQAMMNDKGFQRPLYDPNEKGIMGIVHHTGAIALNYLTSQLPMPSVTAAYNALTGHATPTEVFKGAAPLAGFTLSSGHPKGPAAGVMAAAQKRADFEKQGEMPSVRDAINSGDIAEAVQGMRALHMTPHQIQTTIRGTMNPSRLSAAQIRDFRRIATPDEWAAFQNLRSP